MELEKEWRTSAKFRTGWTNFSLNRQIRRIKKENSKDKWLFERLRCSYKGYIYLSGISPSYLAPPTFHPAGLRIRNSTRPLDLNGTEYSGLQIIHKTGRTFSEPWSNERRCSEGRKVIFNTLLNTIYERNWLAMMNLKQGKLWIRWLLCDRQTWNAYSLIAPKFIPSISLLFTGTYFLRSARTSSSLKVRGAQSSLTACQWKFINSRFYSTYQCGG